MMMMMMITITYWMPIISHAGTLYLVSFISLHGRKIEKLRPTLLLLIILIVTAIN